MKWVLLSALLTCTVTGVTLSYLDGPREKEIRVSASDFPSGEWPFTVDEGVLLVTEEGHLLFVAGGRNYGLDLKAREAGYLYPDSITIRTDEGDTHRPIVYKKLDPLIRHARVYGLGR